MSLPNVHQLYAVVDGTWPAASVQRHGPWNVRIGQGGGSRVSAATAMGAVHDADIPLAEAATQAVGQTPLFMIREGDAVLDALLAERGYLIKDPVNLYAAPVADIATHRPPPVTTFDVWPPLAVQGEIWAAGGIGPGRLAVMDRAAGPKTTVLGRVDDRPAATLYVAISGDCAMIHALETATTHRRKGLARHLTVAAAFWAQTQGATFLTLVTTQENVAANTLYTSLGMTCVGQYHYRIQPETARD